MDLKQKLASLYNDHSKHANYQNIPEFVSRKLGYSEIINESWRGDTARYSYIKTLIPFSRIRTVADIGSNTGFFSLSLANEYKTTRVLAFDTNLQHIKFIQAIKQHFGMENIDTVAAGVDLASANGFPAHDAVLLLNVLHHAGVDFDEKEVRSEKEFSSYAVKYLGKIRSNVRYLIFQMGYNWGGNKQKPLITGNSIAAMICLVAQFCKEAGWSFQRVGIFSRVGNELGAYHDLPQEVLDMVMATKEWEDCENKIKLSLIQYATDSNSEFYKRPIFLLRNISMED